MSTITRYEMRLELPQQPSRVVMYAMKKAASKTPHYVISLEQDDLKRVRHERSEKSFIQTAVVVGGECSTRERPARRQQQQR